MPSEVIESRADALAQELESLHVFLAVEHERARVSGGVRAALVIDARDNFRQTQLLAERVSFATTLPESLFRMAATSELALSFKRFGFLLSDHDEQMLQRLRTMTGNKLLQCTPHISLPLHPHYPGFGSANIAYFSAPFSAFYGEPGSRRPHYPDLDFLFFPGVTQRMSELE